MSNRKKERKKGAGSISGALGALGVVSCGRILQRHYSNRYLYQSIGKNEKRGKPPPGRRWLSSSGYLPTPEGGSQRFKGQSNQRHFKRKCPAPSREKPRNGKKNGQPLNCRGIRLAIGGGKNATNTL